MPKLLTPARREKLQAASTALLDASTAQQDPKDIIAMLQRDHGATFNSRCGNEMSLSCAGVRSTCTWGATGLINNWRKAASLKLMENPA